MTTVFHIFLTLHSPTSAPPCPIPSQIYEIILINCDCSVPAYVHIRTFSYKYNPLNPFSVVHMFIV